VILCEIFCEIFAAFGFLFSTSSCVKVCQEAACPLKMGADCVFRNVVTSQLTPCKKLDYVTAATSNLAWFVYLWLRWLNAFVCAKFQVLAANDMRTALF